MRKLLPPILLCLLALVAFAQEKKASENTLSAFTKRVYGFQKDILLRSAEKGRGYSSQLRTDHRTCRRRPVFVLLHGVGLEEC